MPKCDFNKITLRYGCYPVTLLHILKTPFYKNTSGGLRLQGANATDSQLSHN